ncbi:2-dehydropantoate 2-reductase [Paracoccaceae bacterium]|nr:2-dehydropantoate 2-reductase [Paracoccaceae bacterium]
MKIATMATGGIGGYLAVKLTQAGHQVACVARGAHLSAIQTHGLKLNNPLGQEVIRPWKVSEDPAEIGPVDAIIFGVKIAALDQAAQKCPPMLGEHTVVIPFQNGVTATSDLMRFLPSHNVASGVALISTTISEPGVITQTGGAARFIFAERDSVRSDRIAALQTAFQQAGIAAPETKDITHELWMKFVLFSAMSGITATARCTVGDILTSQALGRLFCQVMEETAMIGRAHGVPLKADCADTLWLRVQDLPLQMRASTAIDLEHGRPLESPWISGSVPKLANQVGLQAPLNAALYALLKPYEKGVST